jgi:hypothetical protein
MPLARALYGTTLRTAQTPPLRAAMRSDVRGRAALKHCDGVLQSARLFSLEARVWVGVQADMSVLDRVHFGMKQPPASPAQPLAVCNALSIPDPDPARAPCTPPQRVCRTPIHR